MNSFTWQHIEFGDGSNPYICKTEEEFKRLNSKHNLVYIQDNFWLAKSEQGRTEDLFCADLLMEQQEQM